MKQSEEAVQAVIASNAIPYLQMMPTEMYSTSGTEKEGMSKEWGGIKVPGVVLLSM